MTRGVRFFLTTALLFAGVDLHAQKYSVLGPQQCLKCHDHEGQKTWWEKRDGPPPNGHINSLRQMENPKSDGFAAAIGVTDKYDPAGPCVKCHATVFKGQPRQGVSCESCHGPASGYIEVHQEKNAYDKALAAGMFDVRNKPNEWVRRCLTCHVMDDARLVAAGHPPGDQFDVAAKFTIVAGPDGMHWKSKHDRNAVAAIAQPVRTAAVARRGPAPGAPAATLAAAAPGPSPAAATSAAAPPPAAPIASGVPARPPLPGPPAAVPPTAASAATAVPAAPPRSPVAAVAALKGRALVVLADLLRAGSRAAVRVTPPQPPPDYRGVDAELLRLQDEVLALALEALGTAPTPQPELRPASAEQKPPPR